MSDLKRVSLRIRGRVQGVGFRYFAYHEARRLGVVGFVRNLPDGEVGAEAEADAAVLDVFVQALKQGPSAARVREVQICKRPCTGQEIAFEVRY
ncbi:MAG: acylphosphatase [bacterium]|nr:acylphosphatase [bacterium]